MLNLEKQDWKGEAMIRQNFKLLENLTLTEEDRKRFWEYSLGEKQTLPHQQIHKAFEEKVANHPKLIAVTHGSEKITYNELNGLAEALAFRLAQLGCSPQKNVGLFLERSIPMVAGILGILKTGAAYVPQDARMTPLNQLGHIIKTSNIELVLTLSHLKHRIPQSQGVIVISLDEILEELKTSKKNFQQEGPSSLENSNCFILYTSGTTGLPNGVKVSHKNVCNIILSSPGNLGIQPKQKVSQILNISFDMATWEIFAALSHGATLVIRKKSVSEVIAKVDVVIATPSILTLIDPKKNRHIQTVAVAGEPCPVKLAEIWAEYAKFYNCCGPTETTIVNTMKLIEGPIQNRISVGKPTPNNTVYILDEDLKPCPIGDIGEMWAGGFCVTQGYINNEELTKERYKPDPFLGEGHVMFRTRDLGRWTKEGELEHFGRSDDQVKIKGFRIELDSISTVLESIPGCKQAVTIKIDSNNLVSFIRPGKIDFLEAKETLKEQLSYYSVPSLIIPLEEFPRTDRGKIDKKKLTVIAVNIQEQTQNTHILRQEAQI